MFVSLRLPRAMQPFCVQLFREGLLPTDATVDVEVRHGENGLPDIYNE